MSISLLLAGEKSCYTVQLTSSYKTQLNYQNLLKKKFDSSCKVMSIGNSLSVRCGCYEHYKEADTTLAKYRGKYPSAFVRTTYVSRFESLSTSSTLRRVEVLNEPVANALVLDLAVDESAYKEEPVVPKAKKKATTEKKKKKKNKKKHKKKKSKKKKKHKKHKKKKSKKKYKKSKKTSSAKEYGYNRYLRKLESKRGIGPYDYRYKFGAQLSYDLAYIDEADQQYFKNDWRRVRVYNKGSFFRRALFYELEYSFTGPNHYKDIFLGYKNRYKPFDLNYRVKFGNIKIPFSLERYTSSKYNTFMERALVDAYGESRKLGGELLLRKKFKKKHYTNLFLSYFGNSIDERIDSQTNTSGYSIRGTYAYKFRKNHLISIGGAYFAQNMNGADVKFNESAESFLMNDKYISASVKNVDTVDKQNLELLYIYDKYSLQGEYTLSNVRAINKSRTATYVDYSFYGYYLQGSYFLIGNGRKYKLSNSTIKKPSLSKEGAIELAFRYSFIDLNSEGVENNREVNNGTQSDYTLGVNYYHNDEIKLMVNYIIAEPKDTKLYSGRLQVLQARILFAF